MFSSKVSKHFLIHKDDKINSLITIFKKGALSLSSEKGPIFIIGITFYGIELHIRNINFPVVIFHCCFNYCYFNQTLII